MTNAHDYLDTQGAGEHAIGDTVRVGKGKKLWTIDSFWAAPGGEVLASLHPLHDGYSGNSAALDRLTRVDPPAASARRERRGHRPGAAAMRSRPAGSGAGVIATVRRARRE